MKLFNVRTWFELPAQHRLHYCTWWLLGALSGLSEFSPHLTRLYQRVIPARFQSGKGRNYAPFSDGYDTSADAVAARALCAESVAQR